MISKVLIIAGMHRSGTSLITQWLHRCGLFIGANLVPANVGNVEGHFEDSDFLALHERFLLKRNCQPSGFIDKPVSKLVGAEKHQLKELIESKSRENKEWGWKEPRTCLFLDEYNELIPSAFYLFIVRGYRPTINSLVVREHKIRAERFQTKKGLSRIKWILLRKKSSEKIFRQNADRFLKIWIYYYKQILNHLLSLPSEQYLLVHYSYLLQNDKEIFDRLKNEWHFSLAYFPFAEVFKKELLSEVTNVDKYIKDKRLIARAKEIEEEIYRHSVS